MDYFRSTVLPVLVGLLVVKKTTGEVVTAVALVVYLVIALTNGGTKRRVATLAVDFEFM